jgi:hypothetical protein
MRIRECPKRGLKANAANPCEQFARRLETGTVDGRDIRANISILGRIAIEALADLDLIVLCR